MCYQGGLNKKEKEPNHCSIFSISMKLKSSMKLNLLVWSFFSCVKFTFVKYIAGIVSLIFPTGNLKGAFSILRQFLAAENSLKMMKKAFCFNLKALLVLKIFNFLSWSCQEVA